ncbi:MAG TPA: hypothetical protein VG122_08515 [Gemmata sp.]|jgi:hypothetical protein|nr:hypothetical protein [Gemmata sp.]
MLKRDEWITRIKQVEQEYEIATLAVAFLAERMRTDPTVLPEEFSRRMWHAPQPNLWRRI